VHAVGHYTISFQNARSLKRKLVCYYTTAALDPHSVQTYYDTSPCLLLNASKIPTYIRRMAIENHLTCSAGNTGGFISDSIRAPCQLNGLPSATDIVQEEQKASDSKGYSLSQ
jgi:hypothetical protein